MTNKRRTGRPSRERAESIEDDLLCAARTMFCEHGIARTSMDDIARVAGMTKQTIYRRHAGKAALIDAVVNRDLSRLAEIRPGDEPMSIESLKTLTRSYADFYMEPGNVQFLRFLIAESAYSPHLRAQMGEWRILVNQALEYIIASGQEAKLLRAGNSKVATRLLSDLILSPGNALIFNATDPFEGMTADEFFERSWSIFLTIWGAEDAPDVSVPMPESVTQS